MFFCVLLSQSKEDYTLGPTRKPSKKDLISNMFNRNPKLLLNSVLPQQTHPNIRLKYNIHVTYKHTLTDYF